jgi:hypothetical protein
MCGLLLKIVNAHLAIHKRKEREGYIVITQSMLCEEDTWDKSVMPKRPIILVTKIENGKEAKKKYCPRKGKSALKKTFSQLGAYFKRHLQLVKP